MSSNEQGVVYGTAAAGIGDRAEELDLDTALAKIAQGVGTLADAEAAVIGDHGEFEDRTHEIFKLTRDKDTFEVRVESDLTLEDYKSITHPRVWALVERWAANLQGRTVSFVNPTMEGGGVAMLRPTIVHLFNMLGIKAHWFVMAGPTKQQIQEEGNPFDYTKLMHNISQRQAEGARIDEPGKALHNKWAQRNWKVLSQQDAIRNADIMVFDDPQPVPFLRQFKDLNPTAVVGWRNHIDTDGELMADPTTEQGEVSNYILDECGVIDADFVVAHPNPKFINRRMMDKTYLAPATIDPFDNLNRHLSDAEVVTGMEFINFEIEAKNAEFIAQGRYDDVQELLSLDPDTLRVTIVARFDESKAMDKAMALGVKTKHRMREMLLASGMPEEDVEAKIGRMEIVIIGNGSKDDPSGPKMYEEMLRIRREEHGDDAKNITIMRIKHNYDAINALMRRSKILMQTSDAEGCETRISDGVQHGLPIVISNRGAMYTQIPSKARKGSKSSYIMDYDKPGHDLDNGAEFMANLLTDKEAYAEASKEALQHAAEYNRVEFSTISNGLRWLGIMSREMRKRQLRTKGDFAGADEIKAHQTWLVHEMVAEEERKPVAIGALALAAA